MIVVFYVAMIVAAGGALAYAMYISAPTIWRIADAAWRWWAAQPVDSLLRDGSDLVAVWTGAVIDMPPLWDPWGAAAAIVLAALAVWAVLRYLPRFIAGEV